MQKVTVRKKNDYSIVDSEGKITAHVKGGRIEYGHNANGYVQSVSLEEAKRHVATLQLFIDTEEADNVVAAEVELPF